MSEPPEARPGGAGSADGDGETTVSSAASALFDLRSVIAALFGVYGIVLLIMGLVSGDDPANLAKTGGSNLNLETGIAMLVVGALFVVWTVARPLKLPPQEELDEMKDAGPGGH